MALEFAADAREDGAYPFAVTADARRRWAVRRSPTGTPDSSPLVLDWQPLVEAVLADLRRGVAAGIIAARFHNALVDGDRGGGAGRRASRAWR